MYVLLRELPFGGSPGGLLGRSVRSGHLLRARRNGLHRFLIVDRDSGFGDSPLEVALVHVPIAVWEQGPLIGKEERRAKGRRMARGGRDRTRREEEQKEDEKDEMK